MAILNVRQLGDEILTKKCKPVRLVTPRIRQLVDDMYDTMYETGGVGLAAPQVGILKRIVVIDVTPEPEEGEEIPEEEIMRFTMINPEILEKSGEQRGYEGCLSYVGMSGIVTRPEHVKVRFTDLEGDEYELEGDGLLARCICHEVDHLEGHMYTDFAEPGSVISNEELAKQQKEAQEEGKEEN
ncbi:MAG: peptide deformylase [Lachnospiraceae bacterium]|nr:peptide deformylase [Lachnospiraceae bacterium]